MQKGITMHNQYHSPTTNTKPLFGISGSTVKLIAMFCMFLDHFAAILIEQPLYRNALIAANSQSELDAFLASHNALIMAGSFLRSVGRIAFPLFAFLLVEGFLHTHSKIKYCRNLFLMALLAEIPFDLAFSSSIWNFASQNTLFTLTLGLLTIWALSHLGETCQSRWFNLIYTLLITAVGCGAAYLLQTDYNLYGILAIVLFYLFRTQRNTATILACGALSLLGPEQWFCFLALIPILKYNGSRGLKLKYTFYLFYPVHLLVLYAVAQAIGL